VKGWTGFKWFRIGSNGGFHEHDNESFGTVKVRNLTG
jgi:hypothetical protein